MKFDRRRFLESGASMAAVTSAPSLWAQANKGTRKIILGQSVPLTGAADQIGTA